MGSRHFVAGRLAWTAFTLLVVGALSCTPQAGGTDSNSHWLRACSLNAPCGSGLECFCGRCSLACESDISCNGISDKAVCGMPDRAGIQCADPEPICLPSVDSLISLDSPVASSGTGGATSNVATTPENDDAGVPDGPPPPLPPFPPPDPPMPIGTDTQPLVTTCPSHPNVVSDGDQCVLSGTVQEDLTLRTGTWRIQGVVRIGTGTGGTADDCEAVGPTLTVQGGVTVLAEPNSTLIVERGSKILALGKADAPIVFTPDAEPGTRFAGYWGGIALNGRAPTNGGLETEIAGGGLFGGECPLDDSGVLRYVRLEFGGEAQSTDGVLETQALRLSGVGSGTEVNHVEVHNSSSRGVLVRGGSVNISYLIVNHVGGRGLEAYLGWRGALQLAVFNDFLFAGIALANDIPTPGLLGTHMDLSRATFVGYERASETAVDIGAGASANLNRLLVASSSLCVSLTSPESETLLEAGATTMTDSLVDCLEFAPLGNAAEALQAGGTEVPGILGMLVDPLNVMAPDFRLSNEMNPPGAGALYARDTWADGWTAYPEN